MVAGQPVLWRKSHQQPSDGRDLRTRGTNARSGINGHPRILHGCRRLRSSESLKYWRRTLRGGSVAASTVPCPICASDGTIFKAPNLQELLVVRNEGHLVLNIVEPLAHDPINSTVHHVRHFEVDHGKHRLYGTVFGTAHRLHQVLFEVRHGKVQSSLHCCLH